MSGNIKVVNVTLKRPGQRVIPRQGLTKFNKFDVVVGVIINPGHFYLQLGKSRFRYI